MAVSSSIHASFDICIYLVAFLGWAYNQKTVVEIESM
jgi:hypothetical protein